LSAPIIQGLSGTAQHLAAVAAFTRNGATSDVAICYWVCSADPVEGVAQVPDTGARNAVRRISRAGPLPLISLGKEVAVDQLFTKSSLTPESARLIELVQAVNFGRIEALRIRGGQPVFKPAPRVIQKVKIGADNGPRPEATYADFRLKSGIIELLDLFTRFKDGEVRSIEVRCGLPVSTEIEWGPEVPGIADSSFRSL
jgi:hypothetical protein